MSLEFAPEVLQIISLLDSTEQLEVLLLLLKNPSSAYDIAAISHEVGLSLQASEVAARGLQNKSLIVGISTETGHVTYQYSPATIELHAAAEGLAVAFNTHSVAVIKALCDKSTTTLHAFSDAFRVRRRTQ